jgi:hypothetical protein
MTKKFDSLVNKEKKKEWTEHPWMTSKQAKRVALDHIKKRLKMKRDRKGRYR